MQPNETAPREAVIRLNSWAGYQEVPCRVVGETPKRFRITVDRPTKLPGVILQPNTPHLVPKTAIKFTAE